MYMLVTLFFLTPVSLCLFVLHDYYELDSEKKITDEKWKTAVYWGNIWNEKMENEK